MEKIIKDDLDEINIINVNISNNDIYSSIVKIQLEDKIIGDGFLFKINLKGKEFKFLFIYNDILLEDINNQKIYIYIGNKAQNNEIKKIIELDENIRYIKRYQKPINVLLIEIIENDKINDNFFLIPDLNFKKNYNFYESKEIKIITAKKRKNEIFGKINKIGQFEFEYNLKEQIDIIPCSPICLANSDNIIGLHKGMNDKVDKYIGYFFGEFINELEKDNNLENNKNNTIIKSICLIYIDNQNIGSGFLMKLVQGNKISYYLIAKIEKFIAKNEKILVNCENKNIEILYNKKERFIQNYSFLNLDITVIEIFPNKDKINKDYFLSTITEPKIDINKLAKKTIFIPHFLPNEKITFLDAEIQNIKECEFNYSINTQVPIGIPIFLGGMTNLIGITTKNNSGNFILPIINSLNNNLKYDKKIFGEDIYEGQFKNKKREGYGKYLYKFGNYYIGQWKNDKMNGKGKIYYKDNKIAYEGELANDKFEGNGTFKYKDNEYYTGEWSKGIKHGKGTMYYKNQAIKYQGEFKTGEAEGLGKYILENGEYYIGKWHKGKANGKGIEYYSDDTIKYDGEFSNGKYHGVGKYFWKNGIHYEGLFLNGLRHGKGILFYQNNKIKYEGDFVFDKKEGIGKYISENGDYYIGQWLNDQMHGQGKMYYKNNNLAYEGSFMNNKKEGFGKYIYPDGEYYIGQYADDHKNGKGTMFYKDTKVKYVGDFKNDKFEGFGKFTFENGDYYVGDWVDNCKQGKGKIYYENGKIKYDGDLVNDRADGNGKYVWEDGDYYIGQFSNGLRHGKGILYDKDNNIIYNGKFVKDSFSLCIIF